MKIKTTFFLFLTAFSTLRMQAQTDPPPKPFITTWKTTTANERITIPTDTANYSYDYTVNWGDESTDSNVTENVTHEYAEAGTYTVTISGTFPSIRLGSIVNSRITPTTAAGQIRTVEEWGDQTWASMQAAFAGCKSLAINATDVPDLSEVTNMSFMFAGHSGGPKASLTGDISGWNVGNVTDMSSMFENSPFNGDISGWNVSNVEDMEYLFAYSPFNQNISNWNVSSVTDMSSMFEEASFNGDISSWDVNSVQDMGSMFAYSSFNGNISNWDVSNVTDMDGMFEEASFNGDISSWDVSSVENMGYMFTYAPFNGDVSTWNVSSVTDMGFMFEYSSFNGDISGWNVSSVKDMSYMFSSSPFNGDISEWDISSVTDMTGMFSSNTSISSENYDALLNGWSILAEDETRIPLDISFGAPEFYSHKGRKGRDTLSLKYRWNISGDKLVTIPFITKWETTAENETITIPTDAANYTYSYTVDWGDESTDNTTYTGNATHEYAAAGTYTVAINGVFPSIRFGSITNNRITPTPAAGQIRTIEQWGDQLWISMQAAFAGCDSLTINATDVPDLSEVTNMSYLFAGDSEGAEAFLIGDISKWNVSSVTDMSLMFESSPFNGDISGWDVSKVTDMSRMFASSSFNGDISEWNVSNVTDMYSMFDYSSFNGDISKWNVSRVKDMRYMFSSSSFNGDISNWNVSNVTDMYSMFSPSFFNGDISEWNVSRVKDMRYMFSSSSFNGDISNWNVSNVKSMRSMFSSSSFNGDISKWNVSNVKSMRSMFSSSSFNGDISEWDISSVTNMTGMFFLNTSMSSENYDALLNGWSTLAEDETQIPSNISFGAPEFYSLEGKMGRDTLTMKYRWRISGDELVNRSPFITRWETNTENESVTIPTVDGFTYNYTVNWGDESTDNTSYTGNATHEYTKAGTYTVTISGAFPRIRFGSITNSRITPTPSARQIRTVEQWGGQVWTSMQAAFAGCDSLTINATDVPDLSEVTNMSYMFAGYFEKSAFVKTFLAGDISKWNVTNVTNMRSMFLGSSFNGDISEWDVSNVTYMEGMFDNSSFNGEISKWNVSNVTDMTFMFRETPFNQDVSEWDVNNVTYMGEMFFHSSFNQDISKWNVSSVTDMYAMFSRSPFNQDISEWDINNVTDMSEMFLGNLSMSSENYDKLLIGWSTLTEGETQVPSNITFSAPKNYSCAGVAARAALTGTYAWDISGDAPVPIKTAAATLPVVTIPCEITAISLNAPTANNKCDGTGTTITATHNISADVFPITSDTVITWTYTDNGKSIVQTQEVILNKEVIIPNAPSLDELIAECRIATLTAPTAINCSSESITATTSTTPPITASIIITWTYTDEANNTATQTQRVTITADATDPVPDALTLDSFSKECKIERADLTVPTATDACDGKVNGIPSVEGGFPITSSKMITWTYTDDAGNAAMQTQEVTINDTTKPVPNNDLSALTAACSLMKDAVTVPTATDNCDKKITATTDAVFPITSNAEITWTYTDKTGNTSTQVQEVIIDDTTKPVPNDNLSALTAACSLIKNAVTVPTATDNCGKKITATTDAVFPITSNAEIMWTYIDEAGNSATQMQQVTITADNTDPMPAALKTITAECKVEQKDLSIPTAMDACDGKITATTDAAFPITSNAEIMWTYTDEANNTATQTQRVTITADKTNPAPDEALTAFKSAKCKVEASDLTVPTATDACDGKVNGVPSVEGEFPITSNTMITWTYTDAAKNTITQTQEVIIEDTTKPVPNNDLSAITMECSLTKGEVPVPTATDACDGKVNGVPSVEGGFPITSNTMITWTYTDAAKNTITQKQEVIIEDTTRPVPNNDLKAITMECSLAKGEVIVPTATDACDGRVNGIPDVEGEFPITSNTMITWTYTDAVGNTATQTQQVIIDDITNPVPDEEILPELTVAGSLTEADVTAPTATDNCDSGKITATTDASFPITATTTITWTYEDVAGNAVRQTQEVIIPLSAADDAAEVVIFPNPSGRYLEVQSAGGPAAEITFKLLSLEGKSLLEGTTNTRMDISFLQSGIYLVQLSDGRLLKFIRK